MKDKLLSSDLTEELCIGALTIICIVTIIFMPSDSSNIVSALGGGLVGYLTKGTSIK
jgi:hypothetical protein